MAVLVLPVSTKLVISSWFAVMSLAINCGFKGGDTVVGNNLGGPVLCVLVPDTVVYVNTDKEFHKWGRCLQFLMSFFKIIKCYKYSVSILKVSDESLLV